MFPTKLTAPSELLHSTSIQQSESTFDAYWNTIFPHVKDALFAAVTRIFIRVFSLPNEFRVVFSSPLKYIDDHENLVFDFYNQSRELTHETIEERDSPMGGFPVPDKETLYYIIDRTHELARRLGITKEVKIFPSPTATGLGTSFSSEAILLIDNGTAVKSRDVIDFVLAHELSHIAHNHTTQRTVLKIAFLILDILSALFISPWIIPLCEALAKPLENLVVRMQEKDADLTAMKILNTNLGAIEFFTTRLEENKNIRSKPYMDSRKRDLSPEGNIRLDLEHPPLTKRLAYARSSVH